MNRFALFYQSVVLFAVYCFGLCQNLEYELRLQSVFIDGKSKNYGPTSISKFANDAEFVINSAELGALCGRKFHANSVKIVELVDKSMKFSLGRQNLSVVFPSNQDIQRFFSDIRHLQGQQWTHQSIEVKRMFRYPKAGTSRPTLTPFSVQVAFYAKEKSFYFTRIVSGRIVEADLILQSKKFNISRTLSDDKYVVVLCAGDYAYALLFRNKELADDFNEMVKKDLDGRITCSSDRITPDLIAQIDTAPMFINHIPYLRN